MFVQQILCALCGDVAVPGRPEQGIDAMLLPNDDLLVEYRCPAGHVWHARNQPQTVLAVFPIDEVVDQEGRTREAQRHEKIDNRRYAIRALRTCLLLGEAPFSGWHLLVGSSALQLGFDPEAIVYEQVCRVWHCWASRVVVFVDRGITAPMTRIVDEYLSLPRHQDRLNDPHDVPVEYRSIAGGLGHVPRQPPAPHEVTTRTSAAVRRRRHPRRGPR